MIAVLAALLPVTSATAQSLLRDAETEALFRDLARPLATAAGLNPDSVRVGLIGDPSINAFATLGQQVYFHSGLIIAADNVNQVQGVLAHELGHVAAGHAVRDNEGSAPATNISLLSLVLGAALIAAGGADAGLGVIMAGQQAAMGSFLAFSREQESRTDQAAVVYLAKTCTSGRGMIEFFKRLQGDEYRLAIKQDNAYNRTHPLSGERISVLQNQFENSPCWNRPTDPVLEARFQRVRAKLIGFVSAPEATLAAYPPGNGSEPARYARAYAFHKQAFPDKAIAEVDSLLKDRPADPYYLELKGQVLLESGRVADSIAPLRAAVAASRGEPLIAAMLGHALVQTEDPANMKEAETVLRTAINRDNANPFAWLQLGTIYDRLGDQPRAALATAERINLSGGDPRGAVNAARTAMAGLPKGSPDWLRAQDILLVSEDAASKIKKRRR
ncbi:M48 family metalloprotease [Sandaracinobacteroides saxicola]|nr:M48 family metalloprotease [Sandaracinobacteroides saxicola]